jgi:acylphosphatase
MVTVRLVVSGRVQRVGYRRSIYHFVADKLHDLKGHVKNLSTGQVEIVAQGEQQDINALADFAYKGSFLCSVSGIEVIHLVSEEPMTQSFSIEY